MLNVDCEENVIKRSFSERRSLSFRLMRLYPQKKFIKKTPPSDKRCFIRSQIKSFGSYFVGIVGFDVLPLVRLFRQQILFRID
jgi:hypothetical protein